MGRRVAPLFLVAAVLVSGCVGLATPEPSGASSDPFLLAVYGDSFTAALVDGADRPDASWATGAFANGGSVLQRLRGVEPEAEATMGAFSGARMRDVPAQVAATKGGADLVVVWLGTNDLCLSVDPLTFMQDTRAAFDLLARTHPGAGVVVFALPDLWTLHELHLTQPRALALWAPHAYCADFFNPGPDVLAETLASSRRDALNLVLEAEALAHGFRYSEAIAWPGLTLADFSDVDFFHPNRAGEAKIGAAAWPDVAAARATRA